MVWIGRGDKPHGGWSDSLSSSQVLIVIPWDAAFAVGGAQSISLVKHVRGRTSVSQSTPVSLEEGKSQESSGPSRLNQPSIGCRMLSRSKALKLRCSAEMVMGSPFAVVASRNGRRETGAERRNGWLGGKSSGGSKPMDGSGAK